MCTLFSLITIHFTGYLSNQEVVLSEYIAWVLGEFSGILRAHPTFIEDYGAGTINGVFWVVTVQLQFYVLVPLIYWIFNLNNSKRSNIIILLLILFFMSLNIIFITLYPDYHKTLLMKILKTSFLPWMYMFLIGMFFQRNFALFYRLLSGKGLYTLSLFLVVSYTGAEYFGWKTGNLVNPIVYIFLVPAIFSLAYTKPKFGRTVLRGKDISYGIYIYHMPIVNLTMYYGYYSNGYYVLAVLSITALIAMLSWLLVEKPSMIHKKHPLERIH